MDKTIQIKELLGRITEINEDNALRVWLRKSTRTLDLFESIKYYKNSEKKFIVLERYFYMPFDEEFVRISLIICSSWMIYFDAPHFSISYLKSKPYSCVFFNNPDRYKEERLYPLILCISDVFPKEPVIGDVIPFKEPCMIKAKTHDDRIGFGNEWAGHGSYVIGKKYGDADTPFAIIGIIIE